MKMSRIIRKHAKTHAKKKDQKKKKKTLSIYVSEYLLHVKLKYLKLEYTFLSSC